MLEKKSFLWFPVGLPGSSLYTPMVLFSELIGSCYSFFFFFSNLLLKKKMNKIFMLLKKEKEKKEGSINSKILEELWIKILVCTVLAASYCSATLWINFLCTYLSIARRIRFMYYIYYAFFISSIWRICLLKCKFKTGVICSFSFLFSWDKYMHF